MSEQDPVGVATVGQLAQEDQKAAPQGEESPWRSFLFWLSDQIDRIVTQRAIDDGRESVAPED